MYKNERKNIHFDDKKIKKSDFYKKKKKKIFIIADADVKRTNGKSRLNTLLHIMIMMLFGHYV